MDCQKIQEQLSAYVDECLDAPSRIVVEIHLATCTTCRSEKDALVTLDAALRRTFRDEQRRADVIAERVLQQVGGSSADLAPTSRSALSGRRLLAYLIATTAGFVLAIGLMQPWRNVDQSHLTGPAPAPHGQPDDDAVRVGVIPVAHLLLATGPVMVRPQGDGMWVSVQRSDLPNFSCPSTTSVKTEPGSLCELRTSSGSRIRMNESCEITLRSDSELQLVQGQIWCRTADDGVLRVVTERPEKPASAPTELLTFVCPTNSATLASCAAGEPLQVVAAEGTIDVSVNGSDRLLPPGTFCMVSDGEISIHESTEELLRAESWMQPLLTLAGHGSAELTDRVDALLANIGRTKLSFVYEQDLRSLGEFSALPLMKFVQSDESQAQPSRRQQAMRIIADTAPVWMIPDLITFLEDADPTIRGLAADSLERLTDQTQGLTTAQWEADRSQWSDGVTDWQAWWNQHRFSCTPSPVSATPPPTR